MKKLYQKILLLLLKIAINKLDSILLQLRFDNQIAYLMNYDNTKSNKLIYILSNLQKKSFRITNILHNK